jgi:hypothetical protein
MNTGRPEVEKEMEIFPTTDPPQSQKLRKLPSYHLHLVSALSSGYPLSQLSTTCKYLPCAPTLSTAFYPPSLHHVYTPHPTSSLGYISAPASPSNHSCYMHALSYRA